MIGRNGEQTPKGRAAERPRRPASVPGCGLWPLAGECEGVAPRGPATPGRPAASS